MWEGEPKSYMEKNCVCFMQGKPERNLVILRGSVELMKIYENVANLKWHHESDSLSAVFG